MTNQVNQYERNIAIQEAYQIHDSDEYFKARPQLECGDRRKVFYAGHIRGYQAAPQASESEINSLKQRVEELQADNKQLRESFESAIECTDYYNMIDRMDGKQYFKHEIFEHEIKLLEELRATPTQSLAQHDNEVIERVALALEQGEPVAELKITWGSDTGEAVTNLWEALGKWSVYLASNGEQANLAPPSWLIDAVSSATSPPKQIPDGWKLVPIVASSDQLNSAADVMKVQWQDSRSLQSKALDIYQSMINASPATSLTSETNTEVGYE